MCYKSRISEENPCDVLVGFCHSRGTVSVRRYQQGISPGVDKSEPSARGTGRSSHAWRPSPLVSEDLAPCSLRFTVPVWLSSHCGPIHREPDGPSPCYELSPNKPVSPNLARGFGMLPW
ncbi:hypothetical protein GJAV_G00067510 [Gymnothorax javanicus]|nr:hypothetical protein GJAV_G00067510 [Gymnothorax javanicus]